jgi:alcohol dehydrogenase class IV
MTGAFAYEPHPARVVFGAGSRSKIGEEIERLNMKRALLIASARHSKTIQAELGLRVVETITDVVMHVPIELAHRAETSALAAKADGIIALGGGSSVGLAKAIALGTGLPIIAVPTTYSGSEMTSIWGLTEGGKKKTGRDVRVRPKTVVYDPELLESLPARIAGPSGLNAIAHAMEALYAAGIDPITQLFAEESVRALAASLPRILDGGPDAPLAHASALFGAWLAGACLDRATMGLHHKLCHVLGGSFNLPHADVHAVILPHAARYNRDAAPEAMTRLGRALCSDDVPGALFALAVRVGAPTSLGRLGMKYADLDRAVEIATENPYANPRPIDREAVRRLLEDAYAGVRPSRAR